MHHDEPDRSTLEAARCWEPSDAVPGRPAMSAFRRASRLQHARWRERRGLPIGTQPILPKPGADARPVGSRLPLEFARTTGTTFLSPAAHAAAQHWAANPEPQQSIDWQRLWCDLPSSSALAFNLFGDLAAELGRADDAVHRWWPDTPGSVSAVRFLHSPGRLDLTYTGSLMDLSVAVDLDLGRGRRGVLGVVIRHHEIAKRERAKPIRDARYRDIAERSAVFAPKAFDALDPSDLLVLWLEHLLVLSMLQHPTLRYDWGRLAVVHSAGNVDQRDICRRYADLLRDDATFRVLTVEDALDAGALPEPLTAGLRERYGAAGDGDRPIM